MDGVGAACGAEAAHTPPRRGAVVPRGSITPRNNFFMLIGEFERKCKSGKGAAKMAFDD
jgi:hypothetical protein